MEEEVQVEGEVESGASDVFVEDLPDDKLDAMFAEGSQVEDTSDDVASDTDTQEVTQTQDVDNPPETEVQATPEVAETPPDPVKELENKLSERIEQQERFIQQLKAENGELRKSQSMPRPDVPAPDFYDNPQEAVQYEVNRILGGITEQQEQERRYIDEVKQQVLHYVPDISEHINEMAEMVKADGGDAEAFRSNPYAYVGHAITLTNLARAVKAEKALAKSKAEIESLKKKPDELLRQIDAASRAKPGVTASSGQSAAAPRVVESVKDAAVLSDKQLEEQLQMLSGSSG